MQNIEQQKHSQELITKKSTVNFFQKNWQTTKADILGIIACLIPVLFPVWGILAIIMVIIGARLLINAKRIGENKKFIYVSYIIVYLPILILTLVYNLNQ